MISQKTNSFQFQTRIKSNKLAFTLVELIVVITILAILGTIAFISLQGYSAQARDSSRISDLSSMKTSLELFQLDAGKYPLPTDGVDITYSGGTVWNQGIFGESTYKNVDKLDKVPTDPLTSSKYTYSVTQKRNEYELAGAMEGDEISVASSSLTRRVYPVFSWEVKGFFEVSAGDKEATAIVTGNYNGQMTKTLSGTTCDVLAIPTIIASDIETSTDLVQIKDNERFVYNGYKNLPSSYRSSKFNADGGFSFTPNKLVAYTDTGSCLELTNKSSFTARVNLIKGLQDSYSGTILKNTGKIKRILNLDINLAEPSQDVKNFAGNFVNNTLGGEIEIVITNEVIIPAYNPLTTYNIGDVFSYNGANVTVDSVSGTSGVGTSNTKANSNCSSGDIAIWRDNDIQIWSACNLGTDTAGTTAASYGDFYQWGRNDNGFTITPSTDWQTTNNNAWGGENSTNKVFSELTGPDQILMQGPCQNGTHIPTQKEIDLSCDIITTNCTNNGANSTLYRNTLLVPLAGAKDNTNGSTLFVGTSGRLWSSTPNGVTQGLYLRLYSNSIETTSADGRSIGFKVRCIRD